MTWSSIEWTDATWNPVAGCTRVSTGCDLCYAARLAATRLKHTRQHQGLAVITPSGRAAFNGTIRLLPERLEDPLRWRRPRRIFVNSLSDLFHEGIPNEYIARVFAVMGGAERHTFQVLTKRPARMRAWFEWIEGEASSGEQPAPVWPLPNVWLGVSCEDQNAWDERVELLGKVPAAVRFVSAEPLLGPIDSGNAFDPPVNGSDYQPVDWVIIGGESGPGARPMDVAWARALVAQCRSAGVPPFVKQLGSVPMLEEDHWRALRPTPLLSALNRNRVPPGFVPLELGDVKGGYWDAWPSALHDLRVRQFPKLGVTYESPPCQLRAK